MPGPRSPSARASPPRLRSPAAAPPARALRLPPPLPLLLLLLLAVCAAPCACDVVLTLPKGSITYASLEARFGPRLAKGGYTGQLAVAQPVDACSPIAPRTPNGTESVVLIQRGGVIPGTAKECGFTLKVRHAQDAGFGAAIVFDNREGDLAAMSGDGSGIIIPSVFVSLEAGNAMRERTSVSIVHITGDDVPQWPSFMITFIIVCASAIFVFTVYMFYRQRHRHDIGTSSHPHMTERELNNLPQRKLEATEDSDASCCICLEEYDVGDTIVTLPCDHEFHRDCIGPWLTRRRRVCPLCKRDPFQREATASTGLLANGTASAYATFDDDDDDGRSAEEGAASGAAASAARASAAAAGSSGGAAGAQSASASDSEAAPLLDDGDEASVSLA